MTHFIGLCTKTLTTLSWFQFRYYDDETAYVSPWLDSLWGFVIKTPVFLSCSSVIRSFSPWIQWWLLLKERTDEQDEKSKEINTVFLCYLCFSFSILFLIQNVFRFHLWLFIFLFNLCLLICTLLRSFLSRVSSLAFIMSCDAWCQQHKWNLCFSNSKLVYSVSKNRSRGTKNEDEGRLEEEMMHRHLTQPVFRTRMCMKRNYSFPSQRLSSSSQHLLLLMRIYWMPSSWFFRDAH
jgi:hypothetical protein